MLRFRWSAAVVFAVLLLIVNCLFAGPPALARMAHMRTGITRTGTDPSFLVRQGRSHRALRFEGVVGQTSWFTCGPAAVATLLSVYYGIEATEQAVLEAALSSDPAAIEEAAQGISLLALKRALERFALSSRAIRTTVNDLSAYFEAGGLPLIAHVNRPRRHYIVLIGRLDSGFLVADPSFGMRTMSREELISRKGFEGIVLAPLPGPDETERAAARQQEAIRGFERRSARLKQIGGRMD